MLSPLKMMTAKVNAVFTEIVIRQTVAMTFDRCSVKTAYTIFKIFSALFSGYLNKQCVTDSAQYLSSKIFKVNNRKFARLMVLNRLMSSYIRFGFYKQAWASVLTFLNRNCLVQYKGEQQPGKLLLCTHTGDYWVLILSAARQYEGSGYNFIVPVYQKIADEQLKMYNRITIPGVNVKFINIHEKGMLLKLSRYLKDPNTVVAVFYDLFCYSAGVFNGASEPVTFFNRKGQMTIGITNMAKRLNLTVNFVSCCYLTEESKYMVTISPDIQLTELKDPGEVMLGFLESYLCKTPWQWHFVASLDAYYHYPLYILQAKNSQQASLFARLNHKYSHR